ncbi:MAG: M23 family metallopeptidase [Porticoccaceae bacterium]|nr:M23 family metallopeptidase [Pseudomonadales bacterium]MCP5170766.1 M23 family metallopeptidase [Pseudomonadales bacterium]MCP5301993.1 M23 family metallopeptidase [Pseudomonadales bacterium]
MKVILISNREDRTHSLTLGLWAKVLLSVCLLGMPAAGGLYLGMQVGGGKLNFFLEDSLAVMKRDLARQKATLGESEQQAQQKIKALTLKLAEMQSRLVRLDALGERLTDLARLNDGEFDFSRLAAVGGPEGEVAELQPVADIDQLFQQAQLQLDSREQQLGILESMLSERNLQKASALTGRPINKGWMSSGYGHRTDPFNGRKAWHNGVDFAGVEGADVVAVAAGVVTWSGERHGYGNMIELDHGEGHVTRYGHNKQNRVNVGDVVKKGQVIATMGSTGRSTGPHVHFEVYKHGRAVDPASYIRRTVL